MFTPLEKAVLDLMLNKPGDQFETLRQQVAHAIVEKRESSGVGFFTDLIVPASAPVRRDLPTMEISSIGAAFPTLQHGAGFVLFIRDGVVAMLEGFTYDEPWPEVAEQFTVFRHKTTEPSPPS